MFLTIYQPPDLISLTSHLDFDTNQGFRLPKKVTKTAQYAEVPTKISCMPASVRRDIIIENTKTKVSTTIAMQALLIEVRRKRITGTNKISTAIKTTISRAQMEMRGIDQNSILESPVGRSCFLPLKNI
jgi:hypothetical protein